MKSIVLMIIMLLIAQGCASSKAVAPKPDKSEPKTKLNVKAKTKAKKNSARSLINTASISTKHLWNIKFRDISEIEEFRLYSDVSGAMIASNYAASIYKHNDVYLITLEHVYREDDDVSYSILDAITFKTSIETFSFSANDCRLNKQDDIQILAAFYNTSDEYSSKIIKAWRMNVETKKIEDMSINNIDCFNEGREH